MFEMKLATCATLMGVLPELTDSLKTSYLSRENTYRLVIVDFEVEEVRYALMSNEQKKSGSRSRQNPGPTTATTAAHAKTVAGTFLLIL